MSPEVGLSARLSELKERIEKDPKSRMFVQLADEYRRASQAGEAITVLRRGLEHHPTYVAAWNVLGRLYVDSGRDLDALPVFEKALVLDPQNVVAARLLGDLHYRRGNLLEAIKRYKLARAIAPGDEELNALIDSLAERLPPAPGLPPTAQAADEFQPSKRDLQATERLPPAPPPLQEASSRVAEEESSPFDESSAIGRTPLSAETVAGASALESSDFWRESAASEQAPAHLESAPAEVDPPSSEVVSKEPIEEASSQSEEDFRTAFIPSGHLLAAMGRPSTVNDVLPPAPDIPQTSSSSPGPEIPDGGVSSSDSGPPPAIESFHVASVETGPSRLPVEAIPEIAPKTTIEAESSAVPDGADEFPFDTEPPPEVEEAARESQAGHTGEPRSSDGSTLTMADLYLRQGELPTARQILEELLRSDPDQPLYADRMFRLIQMEGEARRSPILMGTDVPVVSRQEYSVRTLKKWLSLIKKA